MTACAALRPPTRLLGGARQLLIAAIVVAPADAAWTDDAPTAAPRVPSAEAPVGEQGRLDPDRPHFPEASTTVGKDRVMLEGGYTVTEKATTLLTQTYPEALLRVGVLADWLELRAGQSFVRERRTVAGATVNTSGAQDLYLGAKLALGQQNGWLPAVAVIPQATVPTGSSAVGARAVLPGLNLDAAWEVVRQRFGIELLVANNRVRDERGVLRQELATGLTATFQLDRQLELFAEWDAFYAVSGAGAAGPRDYAVGGLVYFITPDLAVDARAGVGLNERSNDVIAGVGFAVRY